MDIPTLLKLCEILQIVGFGKTALYGHIKNSGFPPPVKIGKSSRWIRAEVARWIVDRAIARQFPKSGD